MTAVCWASVRLKGLSEVKINGEIIGVITDVARSPGLFFSDWGGHCIGVGVWAKKEIGGRGCKASKSKQGAVF